MNTTDIKHPRQDNNTLRTWIGILHTLEAAAYWPTPNEQDLFKACVTVLSDSYTESELETLACAILAGEWYLGCDEDPHQDETNTRLMVDAQEVALTAILTRAFDAGVDALNANWQHDQSQELICENPFTNSLTRQAYQEGWDIAFEAMATTYHTTAHP